MSTNVNMRARNGVNTRRKSMIGEKAIGIHRVGLLRIVFETGLFQTCIFTYQVACLRGGIVI